MVHYEASAKRRNGRYFTAGNPFDHPAFEDWSSGAGLSESRVLEPFAGANSLIDHLQRMGLCREFRAFDIDPAHSQVRYRDTIADFPTGFEVCVTNPPWLARNSATVRGMPFPDTPYDDLYKAALEKCLDNCAFVAALVPESFVRTDLFTDRLAAFVSLTSSLFLDTGHPVGLALFVEKPVAETDVWSGGTYIGSLDRLKEMRPIPKPDGSRVRFNVEGGNVGLIALDNTVEASIRFCDVRELADYRVKRTGRHITKIMVDGPIDLVRWNSFLNGFRLETWDVLMTSYKGMRKDGMYRRRLDWQLARGIIHRPFGFKRPCVDH